MKLAAIAKIARGITSPEEVLELLEGIGVEIKFTPVTESMSADDFKALADASSNQANKAYLINGKDIEGRRVSAFVILHPVT